MRRIGPYIAIVVILLLVGVAWRYGIITSLVRGLWAIGVASWNLLCEVGRMFRDTARTVINHPMG